MADQDGGDVVVRANHIGECPCVVIHGGDAVVRHAAAAAGVHPEELPQRNVHEDNGWEGLLVALGKQDDNHAFWSSNSSSGMEPPPLSSITSEATIVSLVSEARISST
eukprot:CAMPEP_0175857040 /NCGR_PEP_ID=MMETSP0107_2-20121207/28871_1 /TAXON_ID=195067 ORGANISM="Goniomonas pacifica, Strain CCMP1869" /NCGR_SAMPLE_ID=MMETSP0107_2 /ASSEMBLY_ACC=CAM_ASM_000203 /LENGTH=107 /DNA_ID=CAMNT_0017173289 /DNA_START=196 /DNA_END=520 /DNA_ORIENTATION=+